VTAASSSASAAASTKGALALDRTGGGLAPVDSNHHPNIMGAMLRTRRRAATVDRIAAWTVDGHVDSGRTLPVETSIGDPAAGAEGRDRDPLVGTEARA
jgi:hypothetical protein